MALEQDLRNKVKKMFGKDLEWIEPAYGSTVGLPDVNLKIGNKLFPVELKFWTINKKGLSVKIRPSQMRYHMMAAMEKKRTAILFGVDIKGSAGEFYIYLMPNTKVKDTIKPYALKIEDCLLVGVSNDGPEVLREKIELKFVDGAFWI